MEPTSLYMVLAIATAGIITVLLRAVPFAILKKLRGSKFVKKLGIWMPVGIMLILAVSTAASTFDSRPDYWWAAIIALATTVGVHWGTKRNTTLSVLFGTLSYVFLINFF